MPEKEKNSVDYLDIAGDGGGLDLSVFGEARPVDELLIESAGRFCGVDIEFIARGAGITVERAAFELRGEIFQDPEPFASGEPYDITKHWVLKAVYLCGNIVDKLNVAVKMNKRMGGVFSSNVAALRAVCPTLPDIDGIYINIGAPWIPPGEYDRFLRDLLRCSHPVEVTYNNELFKYKVKLHPDDAASPLNLTKYGVKGTQKIFGRVFEKQYLTAADIFKDTANGKVVRVYDYVEKGIDKRDPVLNKEKTIEAQEKQSLISAEFRRWVHSDYARKKRFADYYNGSFAKYAVPRFDGRFLKLPDLNPDITLYDHQRSAIARVLLSSGNILLAHSVGAGKTYEIVVSVHELYRMNISKKNMIVVPNNMIGAAAAMHKLLYKDDNILVVYTKDFTPAKRDATLMKIRDGDYTAIYIPYSRFDEIVMSKEYYVRKMQNDIMKLKAAAFNASGREERKMLENHAETLSKKLVKYMAEARECPWLTFDQLNIETLVIDEAHNYKNIGISTRAGNIIGLDQQGSKKSRECLEKAHYVDRLIMATGTPITNSLTDLYTLQTYLQPELLEYHKISSPEAWLNTFGHTESQVECDVDANSKNLRVMTRVTSFHNLGELISLFGQVCDFYQGKADDTGIPKFDKPIDVCIPADEGLKLFMYELSERTENIRAKKVSREEDNLLKITVHGRLAALDLRLLERYDLFDSTAVQKIDVCAEKVYENYVEFPGTAQVVFSDIGTPKDKFNVYDCLADKLEAMGVPRYEIAFVHDAASERARAKLFDGINEGKIRVVIGSTQKIGVGVNIQKKLAALHHLSIPWRPGDMTQREGRILRKGNTNESVRIYRYMTEGSFDSYSWQLLESKQRFIASFLGGFCSDRSVDDIADTVLSYAEVKAIALGDELIRERVNTSITLERLMITSAARQRNMQDMRLYIENAPEKIRCYKDKAAKAIADHKDFLSSKTSVSKEDRIAFGEELMLALSENAGRFFERFFDEYRGFSVILPANMLEDSPYVYVKGNSGEKYHCKMESDKTALGCSRTVDYVIEHLDGYADKLKKSAADVKRKTKAAAADLERGNPYLGDIEALKKKLEDIDRQLEKNEKERKKVC